MSQGINRKLLKGEVIKSNGIYEPVHWSYLVTTNGTFCNEKDSENGYDVIGLNDHNTYFIEDKKLGGYIIVDFERVFELKDYISWCLENEIESELIESLRKYFERNPD